MSYESVVLLGEGGESLLGEGGELLLSERGQLAAYTKMTALEILVDAAERMGQQPPSSLTGTSDHDRQWRAALRVLTTEVTAAFKWQALTYEAFFSAVAQESQGDLEDIAPAYKSFRSGTFFNRTQQKELNGPLNDEQWQAMLSMTAAGPNPYFRIRDGQLLIYPVPTAGDEYYFEYEHRYPWRVAGSSVPSKPYATLDTDVFLLDDELAITGAAYCWKRIKGLDFASEFASFTLVFKNLSGEDGTRKRIRLDEGERRNGNYRPGVMVPSLVFAAP